MSTAWLRPRRPLLRRPSSRGSSSRRRSSWGLAPLLACFALGCPSAPLVPQEVGDAGVVADTFALDAAATDGLTHISRWHRAAAPRQCFAWGGVNLRTTDEGNLVNECAGSYETYDAVGDRWNLGALGRPQESRVSVPVLRFPDPTVEITASTVIGTGDAIFIGAPRGEDALRAWEYAHATDTWTEVEPPPPHAYVFSGVPIDERRVFFAATERPSGASLGLVYSFR